MKKSYGYLTSDDKLVFCVPYYPIGAIIETTNKDNPRTYWRYGTWELIANGRSLVGYDSKDNDFNKVAATGGEKTHKLTVQEMPSHTHRTQFYIDGTPQEQTTSDYSKFVLGWGKKRNFEYLADFVNTGGDQPHNNMHPYYVCYIWHRIA